MADVYSVQIVDVSDPAHPAWLGEYYVNGLPGHVAVTGQYVYVGESTDASETHPGGLRVLDVTTPARPVKAGFYAVPYAYSMMNVAVDGRTVYLTPEGSWLLIYR